MASFLMNTMLLALFLFCTFNVYATDQAIIPVKTGERENRLMMFGDKNDPIHSCFKKAQEELAGFLQKIEQNGGKDPNPKEMSELNATVRAAIECVSKAEDTTAGQKESIEKMMKIEAELKSKTDELETCIEIAAGDGNAVDDDEVCVPEKKAVEKTVQELIKNMMYVMLEFIKDEGQRMLAMKLHLYGLRIKEAVGDALELFVAVAKFTLAPFTDLIKLLANTISNVCAKAYNTVLGLYECLSGKFVDHDAEEEFHDFPTTEFDGESYRIYHIEETGQVIVEQYINGQYTKIREKTELELVAELLQKHIADRIVELLANIDNPEFEHVKTAIDDLKNEFKEKYEVWTDNQIRMIIISGLVYNNKIDPNSPVSDIFGKLNKTTNKLYLVGEGAFHNSKEYKGYVEKMNEDATKSSEEINKILETEELSKEERNILEDYKQEFEKSGGNFEKMFANLKKKVEEIATNGLKMAL